MIYAKVAVPVIRDAWPIGVACVEVYTLGLIIVPLNFFVDGIASIAGEIIYQVLLGRRSVEVG